MQPLSFTIVDYSSENTKYPVTNIQHAQGRWETAGEETEAFVELQFSAPQRIENAGAAFVEILVKNTSDDEWSVCTFFALSDALRFESRTLTNFTPNVATQEWELVQVSLKQPWEPHCTIGLTQLSIYAWEGSEEEEQPLKSLFMKAEKKEIKLETKSNVTAPKVNQKKETKQEPMSKSSGITFAQLKSQATHKAQLKAKAPPELVALHKQLKSHNKNFIYPENKEFESAFQIFFPGSAVADESTESISEDGTQGMSVETEAVVAPIVSNSRSSSSEDTEPI